METLIPISDEHLEELKLNYDKKFIYDNTCKYRIKKSLNSAEITERLNEFDKDLDHISVPVAVSRLRKILLKIAEDSIGKVDRNKLKNPGENKNHVPWMNDECKLSKRKLNSSRKKYQEAIRSNVKESIKTNLRDKYFENRRSYHKICRKQERAYCLSKNKILIT